MRTSGHHRKAVRETDVRFAVDRPIVGHEQTVQRRKRRKNRGEAYWSILTESRAFKRIGATDFQDLADREKEPDEYYETISVNTDVSSTAPKTVKKSDSITRIYACATMWHETHEEMMEMLKSILRMDEDQCARRVAQKYLRVVDPDYYEFESK